MPSIHPVTMKQAFPRRPLSLRASRIRIGLCRLHPLAQAVAAMVVAGSALGGMAGSAHAQRAFSPAWMAQKNAVQSNAQATGRLPFGQPASSLTNPLAVQQRDSAQLQRSIDNLNLAARGIAAQQAAQEAARSAALAGASDIPDGLADGGL